MRLIFQMLGIVILLTVVSSMAIDLINWILIQVEESLPYFLFALIPCVVLVILMVALSNQQNAGARWMGFLERIRFINWWNDGFLIDGNNGRLSEKVSMQSIFTVGPMGSGKSARFCIPAILRLAERECSLIVSDLSGGELYNLTSGYLAQNGFRIQVLNLISPRNSHQFNPLSGLSGFSDVARAASTIVSSSPSSNGDPFWSAGGEKLIRVVAQCLVNRGEEKYCNLANLKFLLSRLAPLGSGEGALDTFVVDSTLRDTTTFKDYEAILAGNTKTTQSFLATADTALSALGSQDIALLTAKNAIDFRSLRKEKTALFILARQQDLRHLAFIANLFFVRAFDILLEHIELTDLSVFILLDEFGQLKIPDFDVAATTARKYRVALWTLVQSTAQLDLRYGTTGARIVRDSFGSHLYLPGVGVETASDVERRLGKVKIPIGSGDHPTYRSENLIDAFDVTRLGTDAALLQYSNQPPTIITTRPYYKVSELRRATQLPPVPLPQLPDEDFAYLELS